MTEDLESLLETGAQARRDGRLDDAFHAYQRVADLSRDVGSEHCLVRVSTPLKSVPR